MGGTIPKRGGEFSSYIENLKGQYLGKKEQLSQDELAIIERKRQLLDTMTISPKDKERMKRELCRMEAKRIQLELEGKNAEEAVLISKIKQKKALFEQKYGKRFKAER